MTHDRPGSSLGVLRQRVRRFSHDCEGAVAAMAAVSLVVILGFGAFAIDMSYAYATRNRLQVTAEAAALAAAPELPNQAAATAKALEYVEDNMPAANNGMVLDSSDVVFGNWNPTTETWTAGASPINAVEVTTRRSSDNQNRLELFLGPILGLAFLDMETSAVAYARNPTAWDVALVQDVTASFFDEIGDARDADQAMLDCVSNHFVNAKMGLTAFTGTSHIMTPMLPVGQPENFANYVAMSDAIDNLNSCNGFPSNPPMPPCTGTHVGIGIERAIDQLDASIPAPGIIGQAIVIVGDGEPNATNAAQSLYSESDYYGLCGHNCNNRDLEAMANAAADEAAAKGYDVYVVFYNEGNNPNPERFFEGLVRGNGKFRSTPNSDELEDMMFDLCNSFRDLQLVM
jgi:Flp pilus assembly protein TadG